MAASIGMKDNLNNLPTSLSSHLDNNISNNSNVSSTCAPLSASQIVLARKYEEEMKVRADAAKQNKQH